MQRRTIEQ